MWKSASLKFWQNPFVFHGRNQVAQVWNNMKENKCFFCDPFLYDST